MTIDEDFFRDLHSRVEEIDKLCEAMGVAFSYCCEWLEGRGKESTPYVSEEGARSLMAELVAAVTLNVCLLRDETEQAYYVASGSATAKPQTEEATHA